MPVSGGPSGAASTEYGHLSYYTLNIDMTSGQPKQIQLHGYGNERHGKNKEYRHKIPQKVLDFVERWKKEVLMPWWLQQIHTDKKERTA